MEKEISKPTTIHYKESSLKLQDRSTSELNASTAWLAAGVKFEAGNPIYQEGYNSKNIWKYIADVSTEKNLITLLFTSLCQINMQQIAQKMTFPVLQLELLLASSFPAVDVNLHAKSAR